MKTYQKPLAKVYELRIQMILAESGGAKTESLKEETLSDETLNWEGSDN